MLESIIAQSPATLVADAPRLVGDGPDVVDYIEHLVTGKWWALQHHVDFSMLRVLLQSVTQQPRICRTKALMMKSLAPAITAHSHSAATEHV